jgi:signal transduction histidine kinase
VAMRALEQLGNVVLLERPVRTTTLISAVRMALRGRSRQYQIREHLAERERRASASELLAQVSTRLAVSLDYETTLVAAARAAVPDFADWCAVDLLDERGVLQRRALATHAGDEPPVLGQESTPGLMAALRASSARLYTRTPDTEAADALQDDAHVLQIEGLDSAIVVPLLARQEPLGMITFGRIEPRHSYAPGDVELAESLAGRVAHALDSAMLYREVREAVEARDRFISIASHELRTPLTSLLGYTSMLERAPPGQEQLSPSLHRQIATIARQGRRLNGLIDQLFTVSGLQRGQFRIQKQPLDFAALTANFVDEFKQGTGPRSITLTLDDRPLMVEGDALRLEQLLQNLLGNAVKYSPDGGSVQVRLAGTPTTAVLEVQDHGIGIPAEAHAHLFEPFFRSTTLRPNISGFGLGLYIVHEIVTRHGGRIEVESVEGEGTTFRVHLPLLAQGLPL